MLKTENRGYLIPAFNSCDIDYVACANQLADSIKAWHPDANITIVTTDMLPYGDRGGQANDWQLFRLTPYKQTIKLEADMLCAGPIDHWWTLFENRDVVISQGCKNYYGQVSNNRFYRKLIDDNQMPDVYNAITYWRYSQTANDFFNLVRSIFENWDSYRTALRYPDEVPTTDVVYAMAAVIIGVENVTLPIGYGPQIVHMKKHIINTQSEDWTKELVWEYQHGCLRINTVAQHGLVHYQNKNWRV